LTKLTRLDIEMIRITIHPVSDILYIYIFYTDIDYDTRIEVELRILGDKNFVIFGKKLF